ncbi:MAG: 2-succinyl-5-enolpyruvyl-6-hydroxy-3-cyclohexene-1-carboxylic-acid synthase [Calditrichota bacterium]
MTLANLNSLHAAVLIEQFAHYGVRRAVISPGSRSTPLALEAATFPGIECYTILDERSAGFYALGLSKIDREPTLLICTSGTAGANYYPAIIEAAQSGVPLIVLTADRPAKLRHTGAPQTIDQIDLYGRYPKLFAETPAAELAIAVLRQVRQIAAEAYRAAMSVPCGSVQINIPFDEPLAPIPQNAETVQALWQQIQSECRDELTHSELPLPDAAILQTVQQTLETSLCGLIVAGPGTATSPESCDAIYKLARKLGWPLLADIVSGVRYVGEPGYPYYDIFLRAESLAAPTPDVILQFGGYPTSKSLAMYLDRHRGTHTIRIGNRLQRGDPLFRDAEFIETDAGQFCTAMIERLGPSRDSLLIEPFQRASRIIRDELNRELRRDDKANEGLYVMATVSGLIRESNIVLANSMSIRYADTLLANEGKIHRVYGMRGANGIDGTISHATGIATAADRPTLLITGDLAFLHDVGGLATVKRYAPQLKILLLDNNGGGIFHYLPVHTSEAPDDFERLHGMPHDLDLSQAAGLFDVNWQTVDSPTVLAQAISETNDNSTVLYARMDRSKSYQAYAAMIERLKARCVL